jgi:hypothetical protein
VELARERLQFRVARTVGLIARCAYVGVDAAHDRRGKDVVYHSVRDLLHEGMNGSGLHLFGLRRLAGPETGKNEQGGQ